MRAGQNRRAFAICAAVLWLLGVEVLPNLHLATHDADHTHAADGAIIIARDDAQRERIEHLLAHADGAEHQHGKKQKQNQHAIDSAPDNEHAAAGLAHHATALLQPPPPIVAPLAAPHAEIWRFEAPHERIASHGPSQPTARGPPVA